MNTPMLNHPIIAVIGDVHHHIALAAEGLKRIEMEIGQPIAQVFSVGDLGLFLQESDWDFLSGPSKYRTPEASPAIRGPSTNNGFVRLFTERERRHGSDLVAELDAERALHEEAFSLVRPKHWYFGHFHTSEVVQHNGCETCILNINELRLHEG